MAESKKPKKNWQVGHIGGVKVVAEMLNHLDAESRERILGNVAARDSALVDNIRKEMFVFADLAKLEDRELQLLLREVPEKKLALALRKAPQDVMLRFFANLSERMALRVKEEIITMGPQKVADVEFAQGEIIAIAKRLEDEGKIVLAPAEPSKK